MYNEAAMRRIPISIFVTNVQKERLTDEMRADAKMISSGRFWEINTGHDLMISAPHETADALLQIASYL